MGNVGQLTMTLLYSAIPLFLFLYFLSKLILPTTPSKNLPPSPPKLPIVGNVHQIGKSPHRSLRTLSQKYGDIMLVHLGSKPAVVISSAKLAGEAFKKIDHAISGRPHFRLTKLFFYNHKDMLFAAYGNYWRQLRSIFVLHLLTKKRVDSFRSVREGALAQMIETLRRKSTTAVNMSEMFNSLNNDVICWAAFGKKYRGEEGTLGSLEKLIAEILHLFSGVGSNIEDMLPWMGWINSVNGFNAKVSKVAKTLDDVLENIVQEHTNRAKQTKDENNPMKFLVDILLDVQRDGVVKIDRDGIKGLIVDILIAGTHTTFLTEEWTFTEIMRHPRVMKKLQEEVRGVAGDKEWVDEDDLDKLVYLKAVLKESFRLHPPFPMMFPRLCTEDVKLDGYDVPSGTQIIMNVWAIGRHPASWVDPESFVPERFLDSKVDYKGNDFELLPFGAGRRGCPGISFSMIGIELTLANLLHQFDWALPAGVDQLDITEVQGVSTPKAVPLTLVATPRIK